MTGFVRARWIAGLGSAAVLVSCLATVEPAAAQQAAPGQNQMNGGLFGAAAGGLIGGAIGAHSGNGFLGALAGAAIGGLVGAGIGAALDEQDRQRLAAMTMASAKSGHVQHYYNPKTKVRLTTRAMPVVASNGMQCSTVDQEAVLSDGAVKSGSVQACKTADGAWQVN